MPIVLSTQAESQGQGSAEFIDPGTGYAVPAGLDAVLEYNGLQINNREVIEKYRLSEIDGLQDADIRDARELNPSYHGETALDSFYGGRTISLTGRIEAYTRDKLRDMQQAMRAAFGELEEKQLVFRTGIAAKDHYIECRKIQPIAMREAQTDQRYFRDFQIVLRAANPRFLGFNQNILTVDTLATIFEGTQAGNFSAQPIYVISGPITNAVVHYYPSFGIAETLKITGAIANGESITIDIANRTVKDQTGANRFELLAFDTGWPEIKGGDFSFEMTGTGGGGNTELNVIWRDTWL